MQRPGPPEVTPPLHPDGPGIPRKRTSGVDSNQQGRWVWQVVPTLNFHPEPVVHQRIPEVLLDLQKIPVRTVQGPLAGSVGYPACRSGLRVALLLHLLAGLCGGTLSLTLAGVLHPALASVFPLAPLGARPAFAALGLALALNLVHFVSLRTARFGLLLTTHRSRSEPVSPSDAAG